MAENAISEGIAAFMGDKGCGSDKLRALLTAAGVGLIIPAHVDKKKRPPFDCERYRQRNVIERFWDEQKKTAELHTI